MSILKISLGFFLPAMVIAMLLTIPVQVQAEPLFSLDTEAEWATALSDEKVKPVTSNYDAAIEVYNNVYGLDYLYTPPELPNGGLYVYEGDGISGSGTEDAGLVMAWGDPAPADPNMPQLAAWEYDYGLDPNLIGTTLKLTVTPPAGIWAVSLTLNDAALGWNTWDWLVVGSPLPVMNPGAIPLPVNVPTVITLNPVIAANQSGSNVFVAGGFNPAIATTIQADELAPGPGGGAWAVFPTVPVTGGQQPWNYWSNVSVTGIPVCGNGILDPGEQCDDGNTIPGDGCSANCTIEPIGGEGCTPGYWKQKQHFDSWTAPYMPGTLFGDVFDDAFPGATLLDILSQGGGKLNALGRHTVAALLNAASQDVSYDLTVDQVIDLFNEAFPGGDITGLKNTFEYFNELGCPID